MSGAFPGLTDLKSCPLSDGWLMLSEFLPRISNTVQSCDDVDTNRAVKPNGRSSIPNGPALPTDSEVEHRGVASVGRALAVQLK